MNFSKTKVDSDKMRRYLISLAAVWAVVGALPAAHLEPMAFQHHAILDQHGAFHMSWTPEEHQITFQLEVATRGYVALGFSPSGGMQGADIVLGWVDQQGLVHAHDRYAYGKMTPVIDDSQDVEVLGGMENDTHTVVRFSRPWNTCDKKHDFQLTSDTVRLIWAYHEEDPINDYVMSQHSHRGSKSVYLQEPRFSLPDFGPDVYTWDVRMEEVAVSGDVDTLYWCKMFKVPPLPRKTHVIGYVPIIQKENFANVHHVLLYECNLADSADHYEKWVNVHGAQCFTRNMPLSWSRCRSPIIAWAIGSEGEMFPEHVGFPLGEEHGGATYFMMEMHYDNPTMKKGIVDSSGLRVFLTEKLREQDAGMLVLGHTVDPVHIIPPGQKWTSVGHCDAGCLNQEFPPEGVKVFQGLLHAHLLSTSIVLRQIRHGRELPITFQDKNYDFNYQQARVLSEEMPILRGDSFLVECGYDATSRNRPTFGGESTYEEMCLAFLSYYPRTNLSWCSSKPKIETIYNSLGIKEVYNPKQASGYAVGKQALSQFQVDKEREMKQFKQMQGASKDEMIPKAEAVDFTKVFNFVVAKSPKELENKTLHELVHSPDTWQSDVVEELERRINTDPFMAVCTDIGNNDYPGFPKVTEQPEFLSIVPLDEQCDVAAPPAEAYVPVQESPVEGGEEASGSGSVHTLSLALLPCLALALR